MVFKKLLIMGNQLGIIKLSLFKMMENYIDKKITYFKAYIEK